MMAILPFFGSFQKGISLRSENPLEEVWSLLGLYGSEEYLEGSVTEVKDSKRLADYVAVRMRQSIEFRGMTRNSTLLTAPLSLYYSALNLTRACIAIRDEKFESKAHGLTFKMDSDILACAAKITDGTFSQYLRSSGIAPKKGVQITLDGCLARIIETATDYFTVAQKDSLVSAIRIRADNTGSMLLSFKEDSVGLERFRSQWQMDYPSLVPFCELEPSGCCLTVKDPHKPTSADEVASLCDKMLEIDLIRKLDPIWFTVRNDDPELVWPRPAYYFTALFILASIVRYQPELMYQAVSNHSKWSWMLRRFISDAERFYPHLMFNWIHKTVYFFGDA
jgi:YaaC-like Protein